MALRPDAVDALEQIRIRGRLGRDWTLVAIGDGLDPDWTGSVSFESDPLVISYYDPGCCDVDFEAIEVELRGDPNTLPRGVIGNLRVESNADGQWVVSIPIEHVFDAP